MAAHNVAGELRRLFKISDLILAGALVALSLFCMLLIPSGGDTVVVKQNGKTIYEGSLLVDKTIDVDGQYHNHIVIRGGRAYFERSDCPHQECVRMGAVTAAGGSAACAPNGTMIFVRGESEVDAVVG